MTDVTHNETKAEDRIPFRLKVVYGLGAFVNNTLADAIGRMMIVLNLGLGMSPALVGLLGALPRLTDAITDPLMGYTSDNTRSRWGRRRPYIFVGAIAVAIVFTLLWQLPPGKSEGWYFWYFLGGSLIFFLAYTVYATPWVALGYELTPDYHERTRLMGELLRFCAPGRRTSGGGLLSRPQRGNSARQRVRNRVAVGYLERGVLPGIAARTRRRCD